MNGLSLFCAYSCVYFIHVKCSSRIDKNSLLELYNTDRSKAILLLWFYLFYVLESNF